ncbi:hypothetical protein FJ957_16930 [Mesorhizobium sp. B2-4-6]|nr:hypothetical protein FJ957_16930 [Mesorhizobium sp. B2-4-6]
MIWLMISADNLKGQAALVGNVRRQLGSRATRRFAQSLPSLRIHPDIPDHFKRLLKQLEHEEKRLK